MRKIIFTILIFSVVCKIHAQNWNIFGNANIAPGSNYFGTKDSNDVVFRTNASERGRLFASGKWRFGTSSNNASINSNGVLTFSGNGVYQLSGNKYVFQFINNKNYGLFYNSTKPQYEFRNGTALPVFFINADNGNGVFKGSLKIGAYTLPATDGTTNQVLKTNGSGVLTWKTDNNTTYKAGNGISIIHDSINSTIKETQWTNSGNKIYYNKGNVGIGVSSPAYKLDVRGDVNLDSGNVFRMEGKRMFQYDAYGFNIAIGDTSRLTGFGNTAIGLTALQSNTTGNDNTAVGGSCLYRNTTGTQNTALGVALVGNISGNYNTATGNNVLINNNSGSNNTAAGFYTMYYNNTGSNNTAIGSTALYENLGGIYNTAEGVDALYGNENGNDNVGIGVASLYNTTASDLNTAVGYHAGYSYDNGYNNVFVGAFTDVNGTGFYNDIAIGLGATCTDVSQARFGNSATVSIGGYASWTNISDGRVKKNIKQNVPGLAFINKLQPITYNLDLDAADKIIQYQRKDSAGKTITLSNLEKNARTAKEKILYTGFVAQDVEKVAKNLNYDFSGVDAANNDKSLYGLRYAEFVVPLVKAVQELSKMNNERDASIDSLKSEIGNLKSEIENIKAMIVSGQSTVNGEQATINSNISSASLSQNVPNPYNHTTSIAYNLPAAIFSAKIVVTDNLGKILKTINVSGQGKGVLHLDASTLSAGSYNYSLYANEKLVDTKKMVLTK